MTVLTYEHVEAIPNGIRRRQLVELRVEGIRLVGEVRDLAHGEHIVRVLTEQLGIATEQTP